VKKIGCLIGLIGVVMFAGSIALFATIGVRAAQANKVGSLDLQVGQTGTTEVLTVSTDKACQVAVQIHIESDSVDRGVGSDDDMDVQYDFPFSYRVLDADGKVLHSQDTAIAYNHGTKENNRKTVSGDHGSERARCTFDKFDVPAPGTIRVEATVQPDTEYNATAETLTLEVYDNVARHSKTVGTAVLLVILGPLVAVLGIALFIIGLARGKKAAAPQTEPYDPGPPMNYEIKD